jgi:polar amino acid transport system substrate-binding protein
MKKIIVVLLIAAMMFSFAACAPSYPTASKVKVIDIKLSEEEYAFGVNKNDSELLGKLNDFLAKIKENGKFEEILNKYFGDGTPTAVTSATKNANKRAEQLWIATNAEFAPFEYKDGNNFYGVDMEIMSLFAAEIGRELVIDDMDFDAVVLSVDTDKCDIAAAGLTVTDARKELVNFSESYYNAAQILVVRDNDTTFDNCETAEDVVEILNTLKKNDLIGVQSGTTGMLYVEGDEDFGFDGLPCKSKGYSSGALAMQDMMNGKVKFVIIDEAPAKSIAAKINNVA